MPFTTFAPIARMDEKAEFSDVYLVSDAGFPNGRRAGDDVTDLITNTLGDDPGNPNDATTPANASSEASEALTFTLPYPDLDFNGIGAEGSYRIDSSPSPANTVAGDADTLSFETIVRAATVTRDADESVLDEVIDIVGMLAEPVPYSQPDLAGQAAEPVADAPIAYDPSDLKFSDGDAIL